MPFGKYNKCDPFQAARRNINNQLYSIQEKILQRFPQRQQRDIMRRTIRQMLENQPRIQNKIKILLSMIDSFQYKQSTAQKQGKRQYEGYSTVEYLSKYSQQRQQSYKSSKGRYSPHRKVSDQLINSFQNKQFYTEYSDSKDLQHSYSNSSYKTPYSTLSNQRKTPLHLQYTEKQSIQNKEIDNNIFSFRTQNQNQYLLSPTNNKSKGKKNELKQTKDSREQVAQYRKNYDGYSQIYNPSIKNSQSINTSHIFKKIANRLKYSSCIIQKISHSTQSASIQSLLNRYKLEQLARTSLIPLLNPPFSK